MSLPYKCKKTKETIKKYITQENADSWFNHIKDSVIQGNFLTLLESQDASVA